ncbi:MAG: oligosaccharide flippase family protein [Deltaproteobacteria bacterium]|nr:oligosaccharide flippase family protein [Deltaproteobacteria bacterium]
MAISHGTQIKKLASHSVIYGLGAYLDKFIGFLLIPLYTRYLLPADYGILALLSIVSSLGFTFLNMGQSSALFRSYFDHDTEEGRQTVISTATLLTLSYCLPFICFYVFYARPLSVLLLGDPRYVTLLILVGLTTIARVFLRIPFALLRAKEKSVQYSALSVSKGFLQILLSLMLVVGFGQGVFGVLLANFASEAIFCFVLVSGMLWVIKTWRFSGQTAKDLLSFGAPLVPAGIAGFVLNLSDRYFLKHYSTLHNVGLYSLGYRLGEVIWEIVSAVLIAYPPFVLANEKSPHARQLYARISTYYFAGIGFIVLTLSVCAQEVVRVMAAPEYHEAYRVVALVAVGQLLRGFVFIGPVGLTLKRKTTYHALIALLAAGLNLVLNFLWIPPYGMMGAAWATVVAFGVQAFLITGVSQWYYPLPFEYGRLFKLGLTGSAVYLASTWLPADGPLFFNLSVKAALLFFCPFLLLALRFFQAEERESALGLVRTVRGRLGLVG